MMLSTMVFLSVMVSVFAIEWGACPEEVEGQWPFNMSEFVGKWFVQQSNEVTSRRCTTWNFDLETENQFKIHIAGINMKKNTVEVEDGLAVWKDPASGEAELIVQFSGGWFKTSKNFQIMATDYSSYALIYSCSTRFWFWKSRSLWYLTRRQSDGNMDTIVRTQIATTNLKEIKLNRISQDFCGDNKALNHTRQTV